MATIRKVRADFDTEKEYNVDVSKCTEDEKVQVQQAFFDVGIWWAYEGKAYRYLHAAQYSNVEANGCVVGRLMFDSSTEECNMTAKEFLDFVYEPEIETKEHIHAELMVQCDAHSEWIPNTGEIVLHKRTDSLDFAYDSPERMEVVAMVGNKVWLKNEVRDLVTNLDNITPLKKEKTLRERLVEIMSSDQQNNVDVYQAADRLIEAGVKVEIR